MGSVGRVTGSKPMKRVLWRQAYPQRVSRRAVLRLAGTAGFLGWSRLQVTAGGAAGVTTAAAAATRPRGDGHVAELLDGLHLPDPLIVEAYRHAALQNVLAAVNNQVFYGYWSVCADGQGFGYGNTYPSLDGHQMSDALLSLGQLEVVKANWQYVRSFQRPNGQLPIAILPALKEVMGTPVEANGGFYRHWVRGDPLRALGGPTYIQNADVLYRLTLDKAWLTEQLGSINLAADFLASLTSAAGRVAGAGYYMERPVRIEYDGVAQCYAADAFRQVGALNRHVGQMDSARKYEDLADRITSHFRRHFWAKDHCVEYIHPQRGPIAHHGLTDVDWSALATGVASPAQQERLWPQLRHEPLFYYGGMPTGIVTRPETYEDWEFTDPVRLDLAAMGRVWYLECWARARMNDGDGIVDTIRRVCRVGRADGYYWRERYVDDGQGGCQGRGASKYCEYPANLVRIIQRFLLGVDFRLDGALALCPTVPASYWDKGFGQTLIWRGRRLSYRMARARATGEYQGPSSQKVLIRSPSLAVGTNHTAKGRLRVVVDGHQVDARMENDLVCIALPPSPAGCSFELRLAEA